MPAADEATGSPSSGLPLVDMHCHLDFAGNSLELIQALGQGGGALSATVDPRDYQRLSAEWPGPSSMHVRLGLGMHPWWIDGGSCGPDELALFEELAARTRFISEIGLDFSERRCASQDLQCQALVRMCGAVQAGSHISLHAVKSSQACLDILQETGRLDDCTCVFHWFSGSSDELARAVAAGCLFSINPHMLATKRGRAYARAIPRDRLLLETDAPSEPVAFLDARTYGEQLRNTALRLAFLRGEDAVQLAESMAQRSMLLLDLLD